MKAIRHLKNRLSFSFNGNIPLKVNKDDIIALNEVIEAFNSNYHSKLEDSLLLFYIFANWKIQNEQNELKFKLEPKGVFEFKDIFSLFQKMMLQLQPKEFIIDEIFTEIRVHQLMNKVERKDLITKKQIRDLIDDSLIQFKVTAKL